jgi:hypothetical protein
VTELSAGTVYNCRLVLSTAASGAGGSSSSGGDTEPVYLDVTTLREPEKQIAETKLRDTEGSNRSLFMPILGWFFNTFFGHISAIGRNVLAQRWINGGSEVDKW